MSELKVFVTGKMTVGELLRKIAEQFPPNMVISFEPEEPEEKNFGAGMSDALAALHSEFCPECCAPVYDGKCSNKARHE